MSSTFENIATNNIETVPTVPPSRGRSNFRKRNRPGRGAVQKRGDSYRLKISSEFLNSENSTRGRAALDKQWLHVGLPEIAVDKPVVAKSTTWIPLSTRGVGAAVALCYSKLLSLHPQKVARMCTIFQAYRACLAQVTLRLSKQNDLRPVNTLISPTEREDVFMPSDIESIVLANTRSFSPVASLGLGIGWFELGQKVYQTFLPTARRYNRLDALTAYRVHAQNLRQVCDDLSRQANPDERADFVMRNSLPGALYTAANRLNNRDVVCPPDWPNRRLLEADFEAFSSLLEFAETKCPTLVGSFTYDQATSPISLVSRYIDENPGAVETLAADGRDSYQFTIPFEETWYFNEPLDDQVILRGTLSLLGEVEDVVAPARSRLLAYGSSVIDWLTVMNGVRNRK